MALTAAEKQRRYRQKLKENPVKNAEAKRKHRERYHAKKKLVKDMTKTEHRSAKRKWKIANKKRRERQKALQAIMIETPVSTPRSGTPVSSRSRGRRQVRRDRSALYRQNSKLQEEIEKLKKMCNKYKKRYQRYKNTVNANQSESGDKKYAVLSNAIKDRYRRMNNVKEKRAIKKIFQGESIQNSRMKVAIVQETIGINKIKQSQIAPKQAILAKKIKIFYDRDDVSRATAGKRETVTCKKKKVQKRYLLDTMKNLFNSFKRENPNERCSYSYFTKQRPFYIKPPTVNGRDTCLCKTHVNSQYLLNALHRHKIISESNITQAIENTVCATDNRACMTGNCDTCKIKEIQYEIPDQSQLLKWQQWVTKTEIVDKSGKKVKITKNIKEITEGTVAELADKFKEALVTLRKHIYNIKIQYRSYREAIDDLKSDEAVLHVDFSENYSCKHFEEIQSHHFGGSRKQVTLHTGVMYMKQDGEYKPQVSSFCTVSGNNSHNPASIWAHLHPVISYLKDNHSHVKTIHIFSDGPATQYRQKLNFHFICTKTFEDYGFERMTWNFFEAGHGKGAADGVGGYLKRAADRKVASHCDIPDAETFFNTLKDSSKIQLYFVTDADIEKVEQTVPKDIIPLRGTMQVHQVFSDTPGELQYRDLSCFCQRGFCACLSPKRYRPIPISTSIIRLSPEGNDFGNTFEQPPKRNYFEENINKSPESHCAEAMNEEEVLKNITNIVNHSKKAYFEMVYSSSSTDNDEPLSKLKPVKEQEASVSNRHEKDLIEKENVHPSKVFMEVYVLVKVISNKDKSYCYLGVAQSGVDEEGEVKIMFFKSVDDSGKLFKAMEKDISYEPYENILEIVPKPKIIKKGRREFFKFSVPLNIFEK